MGPSSRTSSTTPTILNTSAPSCSCLPTDPWSSRYRSANVLLTTATGARAPWSSAVIQRPARNRRPTAARYPGLVFWGTASVRPGGLPTTCRLIMEKPVVRGAKLTTPADSMDGWACSRSTSRSKSSVLCTLRRIAVAEIDGRHEHVVRLEARIDAGQAHEAAQQETSPDHDDDRQRDLDHDEETTRSALRRCFRRSTLHRANHPLRGSPHRGPSSEQGTRRDRQREREQEEPGIEVEAVESRQVGRQHRWQHAMNPESHEKSETTSQDAQDEALGEQLSNQSSPPTSERGPQGHLPLSAQVACHQQVGQVDGGDEQNQQDRAIERPESRADTGGDLLAERDERDSTRRPLIQSIQHRLHPGSSSLDRDAVGQSCHDRKILRGQPLVRTRARPRFLQRQPHVDPGIGEAEAGRQDADHRRTAYRRGGAARRDVADHSRSGLSTADRSPRPAARPPPCRPPERRSVQARHPPPTGQRDGARRGRWRAGAARRSRSGSPGRPGRPPIPRIPARLPAAVPAAADRASVPPPPRRLERAAPGRRRPGDPHAGRATPAAGRGPPR